MDVLRRQAPTRPGDPPKDLASGGLIGSSPAWLDQLRRVFVCRRGILSGAPSRLAIAASMILGTRSTTRSWKGTEGGSNSPKKEGEEWPAQCDSAQDQPRPRSADHSYLHDQDNWSQISVRVKPAGGAAPIGLLHS